MPMPKLSLWRPACCFALAAGALPALAQAQPVDNASFATLDGEIDTSGSAAGVLALAAQFDATGRPTEASAVLERYLIVDPESAPTRTEYAVLLCRLDDIEAGRYEMAKLSALTIDTAATARLAAACGITPAEAAIQIATDTTTTWGDAQ